MFQERFKTHLVLHNFIYQRTLAERFSTFGVYNIHAVSKCHDKTKAYEVPKPAYSAQPWPAYLDATDTPREANA